jgi:hypothetical protein
MAYSVFLSGQVVISNNLDYAACGAVEARLSATNCDLWPSLSKILAEIVIASSFCAYGWQPHLSAAEWTK